MGLMPDQAFILAAGFGTRLRPHTLHAPKPLTKVGGQSLLDHTLDHLQQAGVKQVVVNTHYLADHITQHLQARTAPRVVLSHEEEILDTGGGIMNALPLLADAPFYVLSGDGYWLDAKGEGGDTVSSLGVLADKWDPDVMDIVILLQPVDSMVVTKGIGDYDLDAEGRAVRSLDKTGAYMFTSMRINHPRIFDGAPAGAFSYLELLDRAQAKGRLYGVVHCGVWHHISTPADLSAVQRAVADG